MLGTRFGFIRRMEGAPVCLMRIARKDVRRLQYDVSSTVCSELFRFFNSLLMLTVISVFVSSQEIDDKARLVEYLHEGSKLSENVIYCFDGQYARSRDGAEPIMNLFRGLVARSRVKDVEYYSFSSVGIQTDSNNSEGVLGIDELLRVGQKRFRKQYGLPSNVNAKPSSLNSKGHGAPPELLGLDVDGNPVLCEVPKFCAFGFPLAIPSYLFSENHDINVALNSYLTKFKYKAVESRNDMIESQWFAVNKSAILTVVLDPQLDYRPIEYRVNVILPDGKVDKNPMYKTTTTWTRNSDSVLFPSKIRMTEHSRRFDAEADISITWLDLSLWTRLASETDWKKFAERRGTEWTDFFEDAFLKLPKR